MPRIASSAMTLSSSTWARTQKRTRTCLFTPLQLGRIGCLEHRVVLAPLTRNRAKEPNLSPSTDTVQYYRQRASKGGLLISEATHISPESLAYPSKPGIWSAAQVEAWRRVTHAVHEKGGFIVCQLWHTGRVAHPSFGQHVCNEKNKDGSKKYIPGVSASPVPILNRHGVPGKTFTYEGMKDYTIPRELSKADIERLLQDYRRAAQNAMDAGFDGVEVHAAHGYLIDQFLNDSVNHRNDEYGSCGTSNKKIGLENRCRFLYRVVETVIGVWSTEKVGVRLSPHDSPNQGNTYYGCTDSNPDAVYSYAIRMLSDSFSLAYLLVTEPRWVGKYDAVPESDPGFRMPLRNLQKYRRLYKGIMIGAGGFTPQTAFQACQVDTEKNTSHHYDAIAFGRWFISNPDLPKRLRLWYEQSCSINSDQTKSSLEPSSASASASASSSLKLNRYDRSTFYTSGKEGYIDYPSMDFLKKDDSKTLHNNDREDNDFRGMTANKYELMDPASVGTTLKASVGNKTLKLPPSKL